MKVKLTMVLLALICAVLVAKILRPISVPRAQETVEPKTELNRRKSPNLQRVVQEAAPSSTKTQRLQSFEDELRDKFAGNKQKQWAAVQTARALQSILKDFDDPIVTVNEIAREAACRALTFEPLEGQQLGRWIESRIFNTDKKIEAYISWNQQFSGKNLEVLKLERESVCDAF